MACRQSFAQDGVSARGSAPPCGSAIGNRARLRTGAWLAVGAALLMLTGIGIPALQAAGPVPVPMAANASVSGLPDAGSGSVSPHGGALSGGKVSPGSLASFLPPPGPPDPPTVSVAAPGVDQWASHRTRVTALVGAVPGGYAYAAGAGWLAYAGWDDSFYVAAPPNSVDVIAAGNQTLMDVLQVGRGPFGVAVDGAAKLVFVTNYLSGNVSVINGSTQTVMGSIQVQAGPAGIAYDSTDDTLFVADNGSDNVTVISVAQLAVAAEVRVGQSPAGVAWDPGTDRIFVSDRSSDAVSVLAGTNDSVVGTVPVGSAPLGLAVDNATDTVYVANEGSSNVSAIWASGLIVNATVPVAGYGYPADLEGVAYDSLHKAVWVTAGFTAVILDPSVQRVTGYLPYDPAGVAFDPTRGNVCVTNSANVTFGCFLFSAQLPALNITFTETGLPTGTAWSVHLVSSLTRVGVNTTSATSSMTLGVDRTAWWPDYNFSFTVGVVSGFAPNVTGGYVASNASSVVDFSFTPDGLYLVTVWEHGLPTGTNWSVLLGNATTNRTQSGTGSSFSFLEPNGTYQYRIGPVAGWTAAPSSGTVLINGSGSSLTVLWGEVGSYTVSFVESGLPNGTSWSVTILGANGSTRTSWTSTIDFTEPNGTYAYTIPRMAGWVTGSSNGTFTVAGAALLVPISWVQIVSYPITFIEHGLLANGTPWLVSLPGSVTSAANLTATGTSIVFSEPNGTYTFEIAPIDAYGVREYDPSPASGNVTIAGAAAGISVGFTLAAGFYPITFTEAGLPVGANWSVALGGQAYGASGTTLAVPELNGSYFYTVGGPTGYSASPSSGWAVVRGSALSVAVNFSVASGYYEVQFVESGLPAGAGWHITLAGALGTSHLASLSFAEPNGTYPFSVLSPAGYSVTPASGTVSVAGTAPSPVAIRFNSTSEYTVTFTETGLPHDTGWAVSIGAQLVSSLTDTIVLREPNGTYGYLVLPVQGYSSPGSGFVTVNGTNATVLVPFASQTYPVIVVEFGLPNGTVWNLTVSNSSTGFNVTYSTNGSAIIFYLANGTYSLSVDAAGYQATLSSPTFTVAGVVLGGGPTVHFGRAGTTSVQGPPLGLTTLGIAAAALAAILALSAVIVWRRRSRRQGQRWIQELTTAVDQEGPDEPR